MTRSRNNVIHNNDSYEVFKKLAEKRRCGQRRRQERSSPKCDKANEHHGFVSSKRKHKDNLNVKD